jgi:hypothetical protein
MTTDTPSRKPICATSTLADVLNKTQADDALPSRRKQEVSSALRTLAKALGKPLEEISEHPAHLRSRMAAFAPAMAGIARARWANVKSLTRFALAHANLVHVPGRYRQELDPAWEVLFKQLQTAQERFGLSRLCHYLSIQGIAPEQVDHQVFEAFLHDLENGALIDEPRKVHRTACKLWNKAAATIPDWPKYQAVVPDYTRTYALPWESFPPSLKAEVDAYLKYLGGGGLLEELPFRPLRPISVATRSCQLHEFVSAAVHGGRDPATLRSFADLVDVDVVKAALRFVLGRANANREAGTAEKSTVQVNNLTRLITSIARHQVKVDAAHLDRLKALCRSTDIGQTGISDKNRAFLRNFDDPDLVDAMVCLPQEMAAEIKRTKKITRKIALQMQVAVAIEVLLLMPIRIKNLAELNIEINLIRYHRTGMRLSIETGVKNDWDVEAIFEPETIKLIDLYITKYRPLLVNEPSPWLFPGKDGKSKSTGTLRDQIKRCVKERIGLDIHPHNYRHFAAKHYLDANPGAYGVVRLLLGHKSVDTATRHYCDMDTVRAGQVFGEHIFAIRSRRKLARKGKGFPAGIAMGTAMGKVKRNSKRGG